MCVWAVCAPSQSLTNVNTHKTVESEHIDTHTNAHVERPPHTHMHTNTHTHGNSNQTAPPNANASQHKRVQCHVHARTTGVSIGSRVRVVPSLPQSTGVVSRANPMKSNRSDRECERYAIQHTHRSDPMQSTALTLPASTSDKDLPPIRQCVVYMFSVPVHMHMQAKP